ncbi:MAG: hypothetical protein LBT26_08665 [Clostridiales Family XIII bacterium]|jgi:hypothetical protein|nr:hypothetical protein [Clostridiales Family XIII bacterium]
MSIADTATDLGSNLLGKVEKAALLIRMKNESPAASAGPTTATIQGALNATAPAAPAAPFRTHKLTVQFNPDSLGFEANSQPIKTRYMQANEDSTVPHMQTREESVIMTVSLLFDAVSNADAFYADKFRTSASDVAAKIGTGIKKMNGGYTVQPQTNGILALLLHEETSEVTFVWGDLKFNGIISEAQAQYTMFSPSGMPIRSKVSLRINQVLHGSADGKQWDEAFDKCFGKAGQTTAISAKSTLQELSSLLNIRF